MKRLLPAFASTALGIALALLLWAPVESQQGVLLFGNNSGSPQVINATSNALNVSVTGGTIGDLTIRSIQGNNIALSAISSAGAPTVTPTCDGTCATTYGYKIVARNAVGWAAASSEGTTAANAATLDSTHYNTVAWAAVTGATSYDVYRTTGGTAPPKLIYSQTTSISVTDTGIAGSAVTPPTTNTTNTITSGKIILAAGSGTATGRPSLVLYNDYTATASVTSGETDSSSYTLPADTLDENGKSLLIEACAIHAANTNSTTFKVYVAGTAIVNITEAVSNAIPCAKSLVVKRLSATQVLYTGLNSSGSGGLTRTTGTISGLSLEDTPIIIKISVTGPSVNGDLTAAGLFVMHIPSAS